MHTRTSDLSITTHDAAGLAEHMGLVLDTYAEVYATEIAADPFFSVPRYQDRLNAYASRAGFALALGYTGDELAGYVLGFRLPEGSGWWSGLQDAVDPEMLIEDGTRTVAICEIMVKEMYRRRGYARRLHDAFLHDRTEERATLLVDPINTPAKSAYRSWGWLRIGGVRPFPDSPLYDGMLLDLPTRH
ncbi:GNAT family N-acetyltransferase [Catellatospora methionotrophica]|uniref:GNAT family N-acetyltransferase n=1 Tax=Catellatospora methionotrophica TaxID=121620 RepID=UPI003406199F